MTATIQTLPDLLAHAHALESEAAERYEELAEQMEVHHNLEVAELFRKMAAIEGKHIAKVESLASNLQLPRLAPWDYHWQDPEAPETVPVGQGHYRMTPYQALSLMLACEERALAFFTTVAGQHANLDVRAVAEQLAEEEREHLDLLRQWLSRYPEPAEDWQFDLDEPISQE
jgi:rubrerythrin